MSKILPRELHALLNSLNPLGLLNVFYMEQCRVCISKATFSLTHLVVKQQIQEVIHTL